MLPFPTRAPYRIDQVASMPLVVLLLTAALLITATLMSLSALKGRTRLWGVGGVCLVLEITLLFGLASWGTSDVTKLSHDLAFRTDRVMGESFWMVAAPLIVWLPYRMAFVHGLVSAGYGALGLGLARSWGAPAWGSWWALLLLFSPFLHNFLQNGVSRQALLTLLLVPLLLWSGRLAAVGRAPLALLTLWAAAVHGGFLPTAALALLPRGLIRPSPPGAAPARARRWARPWLWVVPAGLLLAGLLTVAGPTVWFKLNHYIRQETFFNSYALSPVVQRLQLAVALGVGMVCWVRRLGWRDLLACSHTRQLALFGLLFLLVQQSLRQGWVPAFSSRFVDPIGLFLLIVFLAWLERYRARWAVLPALAVTLDFWVLHRLLDPLTLRCGTDDAFLCVPDRWPWEMAWPRINSP
ncbi:MAG: hypothetical protein VKO19_07585 [Cyanobacteriota bacterium]|jgi:hypothetical protein|nr:hypothetical protein [Cyanobacteriota bacterium]